MNPAGAQEINPEQINVDLLPESLRELVTLLGLRAAFRLVQMHGGLKIYIPVQANPAHDIAKIIGAENFKSLVASHAGMFLHLPKIDKALTQVKHQLARDMIEENVSTRDIARALNYTERRVWQIKAQGERQNHPDLFD